jgi:hypothetical protein
MTITDTTVSSLASTPRARRAPWHRRVAGLHVLKLKGSHYEMGRQHGALLRDEIPHGPLPYYRTYVERMLGKSGVAPIAPLLWEVMQRTVGARVMSSFTPEALDSVRGLADGAGLDPRAALQGCSMPDSLLWVASRLMRYRRAAPALHHRMAIGLGCTSAVAWGEATRDGKLLHARNFDYHGIASWPRTAAVVFHEPDDGMRYVSVAAAGVLMGGITAMNEAGLSLTVHQHMFSDRTRLGGTPIGCIGDRIMRSARSIDEAEAILRREKPIGCWTYLITDGNRREMLCWEENPERHVAMRPEGPTFGYANIYIDKELGASELDFYGSYWRHNMGRFRRIRALLDERAGTLDPKTMACFLGDEGETAGCRVSTAIAMVMTVGSVVFRPEDRVLWVGTGAAPTSQGTFVPFSLEREDHAPELGDLEVEASSPASALAFDSYRRAYIAYLDERDVGESRSHMARAIELDPEQPLYHFLAGLLALQQGEAHAAFGSMSRALSIGHEHPERVASLHLWRARAADLRGDREQAMSDYRATLATRADDAVRRAAERGLRSRYSQRRARTIDIDFTFADVLAS